MEPADIKCPVTNRTNICGDQFYEHITVYRNYQVETQREKCRVGLGTERKLKGFGK